MKEVTQCRVVLSSTLLSKNINIKVYGFTILPVVLCGWETWSLIMRKERRLMVFENRVLRRLFGLKSGEVGGESRRPHNEELYVLYSSPNIYYSGDKIKKNDLNRECKMHSETKGACRTLVGKPEGRRPLG